MRRIALLFTTFFFLRAGLAQKGNGQPFTVTAYYHGNEDGIDQYDVSMLTHIIFSFCHLKGQRLFVDDASDSLAIHKLVSLKAKNPRLKVLLSLGGWGGCEHCSTVFASEEGRRNFAMSTKQLTDYFKTDGIDLDWEYPAISGYPGHAFMPADRRNFTLLVKELRHALGPEHEISFAAGGFTHFFEESIEWNEVMPLLDRVNLMTYDLVHGFSTVTGHHTPLYSTEFQKESTDHAVRYLDSIGVPVAKMVIGAAFYGRVFGEVAPANNGLYQPGKFVRGVSYKNFDSSFQSAEGYTYFWDNKAAAPYYYNSRKNLFVTFDNEESIRQKTRYAVEKGLNGIMFWELQGDKTSRGLLHVIHSTLNVNTK